MGASVTATPRASSAATDSRRRLARSRWSSWPASLPVLVAAFVVLPAVALAQGSYGTLLGSTILIYTIAALGLIVLLGMNGRISLAQPGFFAIGAYTTGICSVRDYLPFPVDMLAGVVVATVVGFVLAMALARFSGLALAICSLGITVIVQTLATNMQSLTAGSIGLSVPPVEIGVGVLTESSYLIIVAVVALVGALVVHNVVSRGLGKSLVAVRSAEIAAASIGLRVYWLRVTSFTVAAAFGGLAGAVFAHSAGYLSPDQFDSTFAVLILSIAVIGGLRMPAGVLLAGTVLVGVPGYLSVPAEWQRLSSGILLSVVILVQTGPVRRTVTSVVRRLTSGRPATSGRLQLGPTGHEERADDDATDVERQELTLVQVDGARAAERICAGLLEGGLRLDVQDVSLHYGGVHALDSVSLTLGAGEIVGLIGPNGAGKTTLMNCITGLAAPTAGRVMLGGRDVRSIGAGGLADIGLARTFQNLQRFAGLTVEESVLLANPVMRRPMVGRELLGLPGSLRRYRTARDDSRAIIGDFGLDDFRALPVERAPYGIAKWVELSRALATRPSLLLLDEVTAGLSAQDSAMIAQLVSHLAERGLGVLVIAHDLGFISQVCGRVVVLDSGRVIAEGPPAEVFRTERVLEAYVGRRVASARESA